MELKYGTWKISSYEPADARALCAAGFSPITAALLCSRGYRDAGAAREFLSCSYPLSSPFALLDMDKAAARVKQALSRREHIAVFGDYDVDGITATCLLTEYLRSKGGHVTSYIPARLEEGYGLNPIAIDTLKKQGVELIVTVDCGITANHEAALCRELGIDLVITDHHECKSELPQAIALVDPHRKDQPQPVTEMAGVGVAFKLAAAIEGEQETLLDQYCDFLCLGTVADVMPLTGENRTMVARGLKALENPRRVGIAALMAECSVQKGPVTAGTIGYTLAPRINAAGRMGEVGIATELFLTRDAGRAVELAGALCRLNRPRPVLCMRGLHVTELAEVGGGKHLRLRLSKGTHTWGAIFFSTNAQRAAVAQGDVVDIAFTPQINEYRSVRSVQLNLVDIRPDKAFREAQGHDRAVYKKHLAGGALSCDEAGCLLPTRQDFAAVWRYLAAFSQDGVLSEELGCLSRKISRCAKLPLSAGKTRICLDVLAEQGLLQLEQRPKSLCIRLCANGRKVDLEKSPILIHLKKQKAGN